MFTLTSPLVATASAAAMLAAAPTAPLAQEPPPAAQEGAKEQEPKAPPIPDCGEMQILPSGLRYCVLKEAGEGESPKMGDMVRVDYTGWNLDGSVFDSSRTPRMPGLTAEPAEFAVGGLIEGWNEALQLMTPGDQWKIYVPSNLAYGERGAGQDIKPNSDLIFELEMYEILERAPEFVAWDAEAADVKTLDSGVAMRTLAAGEGKTITEEQFGVVKFACHNPAGGFVLAHTTQGGPLLLTKTQFPLPFIKDALPLLRPGARVQMNVPSSIGIGQRGGVPNLPQGSNEIWVFECMTAASFTKPEFSIPADDELTTTASGLKYKIVREGTGKAPKAANTVAAHYAGWLTDGKGFDNSYDRGVPSEFPLRGVIPGWTEGLQLMKEGGAAIFVIPGDLAYGPNGRPGRIPPNATLVFYVDLVVVK